MGPDVLTAAGLSVVDLDTALGATKSADLLVSAAPAGPRRLVEVKGVGGAAQEHLVGHLQRHLGTWPQLRPDEPVTGGVLVVNHQHKLHPAERVARVYLGSVVVVERAERLASAASGGNGGAIAPDMHALTDSAEFVAFGRASLALYRRLDDEWDGAIGLRTTRCLQMFPAGGGRLHCQRGRSSSGSTVRPCESWSPI
jgi:FAD dependent oxidoreductase